MKGVVLAGGSGTRMQPLTFTRQKQTLPMGSVSLLERSIARFGEVGIEEVCVVVDERTSAGVKSHLDGRPSHGVELTYVTQPGPRGIADAVGRCEEFVGNSPFVLLFGDTIFEESLNSLLSAFEQNDTNGVLGVYDVSEPERCSIVETDSEGRVVRAHEKPDDPPNTLSPIVDVFSPTIFDVIDGLDPSDRGEIEIMDAVDRLAETGRVDTFERSGWWIDAGTPERYLRANQLCLNQFFDSPNDSPVADSDPSSAELVSHDAHIEETVEIKPPVVVDSKVEVTGEGTIGPHAILKEGAKIAGASIKNSVVLPDVTVRGETMLSDSIVGEDAEINAGCSTCQLLLGDKCQIEL